MPKSHEIRQSILIIITQIGSPISNQSQAMNQHFTHVEIDTDLFRIKWARHELKLPLLEAESTAESPETTAVNWYKSVLKN